MSRPIRWWEFWLFGFARGKEDVRDPRLKWWRRIIVGQYAIMGSAFVAMAVYPAGGALAKVFLAGIVGSTVAGWVAYWRAQR